MEDVDTIYAVPPKLSKEGLDAQILRLLRLKDHPSNMKPWLDWCTACIIRGEARIASSEVRATRRCVQKLARSFDARGLAHNHKTVLEWIEAEEIDSAATAAARLHGYDGILVPGGFGKRAFKDGAHHPIRARTQVPFFGICLGCSAQTIEYARDVAD